MIKIVSEGHGGATKIYTESGAEVKGVTSIIWELRHPSGMAKATLEFINVEAEIAAKELFIDAN